MDDTLPSISVVIPTRAGNGAMEELLRAGHFAPPRLASLEQVLAWGIELRRGRVFADLWDVERLFDCAGCGPARAERAAAGPNFPIPHRRGDHPPYRRAVPMDAGDGRYR